MQIGPVSYNYSPNFDGVARIRMQDGSTAVLNVLKNKKGIYTISGDIYKKGKVVGNINHYNEKGFSVSKFLNIIQTLAKQSNLPEDKAEEIIMDKLMIAANEKGDRYVGDGE